MSLQSYIDKELQKRRDKDMETSDQLTLGCLIKKLEPLIADQEMVIEKYNNEAVIMFDFEYLFPTTIDSWRGAYNELALDFEVKEDDEFSPMTVTAFVAMLKKANGAKFTGYKGGEFTMGEDTPVWVANDGNSGNTAVVDVVNDTHTIYLITGMRCY